MENVINNRKKIISSLDNDEERVIHSKSDNIAIMISDDVDEVKN